MLVKQKRLCRRREKDGVHRAAEADEQRAEWCVCGNSETGLGVLPCAGWTESVLHVQWNHALQQERPKDNATVQRQLGQAAVQQKWDVISEIGR